MIITSLVINQDENNPFGWVGQIEFQHILDKTIETSKKSTIKSTSTGTVPPSESMLASLLGALGR